MTSVMSQNFFLARNERISTERRKWGMEVEIEENVRNSIEVFMTNFERRQKN